MDRGERRWRTAVVAARRARFTRNVWHWSPRQGAGRFRKWNLTCACSGCKRPPWRKPRRHMNAGEAYRDLDTPIGRSI
jgi:hypothetical protein